MTNLVIDVGNTFTKIAVFEDNHITTFIQREELDVIELKKILLDSKIDNAIISSVKSDDFIPQEIHSLKALYFNNFTPVPIINNYKSPKTLGLDRLAAVVGAKEVYPNLPVLVIDAGSCITFDFIDVNSVYEGGTISPGLNIRFKAMHTFTGKLPQVSLENNYTSFVGSNTKEAMLSGVINGMVFEAQGYIDYFYKKNPDLKIILCGGDASFFDTRLKNSIFAHQILLEPQLVLIGLNKVINYQHDKK